MIYLIFALIIFAACAALYFGRETEFVRGLMKWMLG